MNRNSTCTEDSWVKALAEGSEDALTRLYEMLYSSLSWYSHRITADRAASEDIAQEAFLKIWEKRQIFTTWAGLRSYLYTTVRRDSTHWLHAHEIKLQKQNDLPLDNAQPSSNKLEDLIRAEVYRLLQDTVQTLPNQTRQVVTMIFIEGMSTRQVAQHLDVSQATVKVQKGRGLKMLRLRIPAIFCWCTICLFIPFSK